MQLPCGGNSVRDAPRDHNQRWLTPRTCQVYDWADLQSETGPARPSVRSQRHSHGCSASQIWFPSAGPQVAGWAQRLREDTSQDSLVQAGDKPILGGVGQGSITSPPFHAQAGTSHLPPALHVPFLLMSGSAAPWSISICSRGPTSLWAGCSEVISLWRETKEETGQVWSG